jgi:hypothetical protein
METISLYDDTLYSNNIKEHALFIEKKKLLSFLVEQIINDLRLYMEYYATNNIQSQPEIRFGYIVYSKLELGTNKMNELLNFMIQHKYPELYIRSNWESITLVTGSTEINGTTQTITADKIKLKLIIKNNDKDLTIKKLIENKLINLKKKNKKIYEYLEEFNYMKKKDMDST